MTYSPFGSHAITNAPIFFDPFSLHSNGHTLILGRSGCGKSYGIQVLLNELLNQPCKVLILDLTGGFNPHNMESIFLKNTSGKLHSINAAKCGCPLNIFSKMKLDENTTENDSQAALRITSALAPILGRAENQRNVVYKYTRKLLSAAKDGNSANLNVLNIVLSSLNEENAFTADIEPGLKAANKLSLFTDGHYIDSSGQKLFSDFSLELIQMQSVPAAIRTVLADLLLWEVWSDAVEKKFDVPLFVIIDEFQNLRFRSESPLYRILCEGRKYGLNLFLSTQFLKGKYSSDLEEALLQAENKIFFLPPERELRFISEILSQDPEKRILFHKRLSKLRSGEAIVKGNFCGDDFKPLKLPTRIQINHLKPSSG